MNPIPAGAMTLPDASDALGISIHRLRRLIVARCIPHNRGWNRRITLSPSDMVAARAALADEARERGSVVRMEGGGR